MELAERAEAWGLSGLWISGAPSIGLPAPALLLAAMAERTGSLRLGVHQPLADDLPPLRAAEDYACVDVLSGGRLELALAGRALPGAASAHAWRPDTSLRHLDRRARLLLALWGCGREVSGEDPAQPLPSITPHPAPLQHPHPPLWLVAESQDAAEEAARLGLGLWLPEPRQAELPRPGERSWVERYRAGFAEAAHADARPRVAACRRIAVPGAPGACPDLRTPRTPHRRAARDELAFLREALAPDRLLLAVSDEALAEGASSEALGDFVQELLRGLG